MRKSYEWTFTLLLYTMWVFEYFSSQETEKLKKQKEKKTLEKSDLLAFEKMQKRLRERLRAKEQLDNLKDLVSAGILSAQSVEHIIAWDILEKSDVKEVLEKIHEITKLDTDGKILPHQFKISKNEYLEALGNFDKKVVLIEKIDNTLDYIYHNMWGGGLTFSLFSFLSYQLLLSPNTQKVQWYLIDIKNEVLASQTLSIQ